MGGPLYRKDGREGEAFSARRGAVLAGMERAGRDHMETAARTALHATGGPAGRRPRESFLESYIADAKRAARVWTELCDMDFVQG